MRIPTFDRAAKAAMTLAVATAVATLPGAANAADPVAADDTVQTTREASVTVNVLANDTVDAGKSLTVTTVTPEALHGEVECTAEGECTYTPEDDWVGTDTFTYGVTDGTATDTGQVTVTTVEIASISLGLTPGSVVWSTAVDATNTVKATGTVRRSSTVFLEGVDVELWYKPFGATEYSQVPGTSAKTSDENGRVNWGGLEMTSRTSLQMRAAGDERSNNRTVVVTPSLNVAYADKKHALGQSLTVTGSTAPATAGDPVVLERQTSTGTWETVQTKALGAVDPTTHSASYAFDALTHEASGSFVYRVVVPDSLRGRPQVESNPVAVKTYDAIVTNFDPSNSDEWVTIKNTGDVSIQLQGWTLSDADSNVVLPKRSVGAGDVVKVHSGKGTNNAGNLFLRKTDWFWGNASVITLADNNEVELDTFPNPAP